MHQTSNMGGSDHIADTLRFWNVAGKRNVFLYVYTAIKLSDVEKLVISSEFWAYFQIERYYITRDIRGVTRGAENKTNVVLSD